MHVHVYMYLVVMYTCMYMYKCILHAFLKASILQSNLEGVENSGDIILLHVYMYMYMYYVNIHGVCTCTSQTLRRTDYSYVT